MPLSPLSPNPAYWLLTTLTMTSLAEPVLQTTMLGIPVIPLITDVIFGVLGLIVILIFHGTCINHIIMRFDQKTDENLKSQQYNHVYIHFYASFIFIACVHICEIILWTFYLISLNLITNGIDALMFAGSCYTTVGFAPDTLPAGWKSLAFFIAFTGLFSIAWTTSIMIGMTDTYKKAWRIKNSRQHTKSS